MWEWNVGMTFAVHLCYSFITCALEEANLIWGRLKLEQVKVGANQVWGTGALAMGQFELNLGPIPHDGLANNFFKK